MYKQALKAYENAQKIAVQLKELEHLVIARATYKMISAKNNFTHTKKSYDKYAEALRFNQKLWTLIQCNLIDSSTIGTASLRKNLLNLSLFIDKQTVTALRNPDPKNLTPLVEINKSISGGLHGRKIQANKKLQSQEPATANIAG
jgi:flagellar protein FlaF